MINPDFLVIGAPRSGTTSLYAYLKEHPQVYMTPVKETRYFAYAGQNVRYTGPADDRSINRNTITSRDAYEQLLGGARSDQVLGEASPIYMYSEKAARRIHDEVPDVKLIAILRNPVERAYSDYLNMVRLGWEPSHDFQEALEQEPQRVEAGWGPFYHYRAKGFYHEQLSRYFDLFERDQLRIYLYEELKRDAVALIQDIYAFLGVDDTVRPAIEMRHNRSGLPRIKWLHRLVTSTVAEKLFRGRLLRGLRTRIREATLQRNTPSIPQDTRRNLMEGYRPDIKQLQELIDRDLSHWLGEES